MTMIPIKFQTKDWKVELSIELRTSGDNQVILVNSSDGNYFALSSFDSLLDYLVINYKNKKL